MRDCPNQSNLWAHLWLIVLPVNIQDPAENPSGMDCDMVV